MAVPCCSIHPLGVRRKKRRKGGDFPVPNPQRAWLFLGNSGPFQTQLRHGEASRRSRSILIGCAQPRLLGSSVVVVFFSPNFFQCSFSFFSWKQDGKLRKKTKQQVKLRLSPWTVARLRAWANCTNYSDTPAATSIRRNYFIILGLHTLISSFSSPAPRKRQSEWLCILRSVLTPNVVAFKNRSSSQLSCIGIFVYIMLLQFSYGNEREL